MLRVLLVDDEPKARRILKNLLEENFTDIELIAEANGVPEAVKAIHKFNPNLVFLDVEMPDYSGFELFDFLPKKINFEVVFATAYNEYAIRAFEVSAVGYLLKPIQIEPLKNTVYRIKERLSRQRENPVIEALVENIKSPLFKKIALSNSSGITFENIDEIIFLKADGSYTELILKGKPNLIVSKKIKDFEYVLTRELGFFRVHRSYIINVRYIKELSRGLNYGITLETGEIVPVSRDIKSELLQFLGVSD